MKPKPKPKPKFKVGQVVRHRIDGGFYGRVIDSCGMQFAEERGKVAVVEQGIIRVYREEQLLPLTRRERGERKP